MGTLPGAHGINRRVGWKGCTGCGVSSVLFVGIAKCWPCAMDFRSLEYTFPLTADRGRLQGLLPLLRAFSVVDRGNRRAPAMPAITYKIWSWGQRVHEGVCEQYIVGVHTRAKRGSEESAFAAIDRRFHGRNRSCGSTTPKTRRAVSVFKVPYE